MEANKIISSRTRKLLVMFYLISFAVIVPLLTWFLVQPNQDGVAPSASMAFVHLASPVQR